MNACAVCPRTFGTANARAQHERRAHPEWVAPPELAAARRKAVEDRYLETNPGARATANRRYRAAHPERARESDARWRNANRETSRASTRAWRRTPEGREAARLTRQQQIAEGKHSARMAVQRALARGDLVREPCRICGTSPAEAHHYLGYAREHWLAVEWLCDQHHSDAHHPGAAGLRRQIA